MGVILMAVDAGLPIEVLYDNVLTPFLQWVGEQWHAGEAAVWEEHAMAAAVRTAVAALYPRVLERKAAVEPVPVTVAFFCPAEENHELGLRMLADRFDLRGFRTVFVGAMTPLPQMVECVQRVGASVVCLSASTHFQRAALHQVVQGLRTSLPGVRIVAGGPAFAYSHEGWDDLLVGSIEALLDELAASARGRGGAAGA